MYMSTDARRVFNVLRQINVDADPYEIELAVCNYYPNHIISVIEQITKTRTAIERAQMQGWAYFAKPVDQILGKREAALRKESYEIGPNARPVYRLLTTSFLLCDFGAQELQILLSEFGSGQYQLHDITAAIGAAKVSGVRNVFYLRGILTREAQTKAGKLREATQEIREAEARAWEPPEDYVKLDAGERASVELSWEERLKEIELNKIFDQINEKNTEY
jgi:hypothetical protein